MNTTDWITVIVHGIAAAIEAGVSASVQAGAARHRCPRSRVARTSGTGGPGTREGWQVMATRNDVPVV